MIALLLLPLALGAPTARDWVERAENHIRGTSFQAQMEMTVSNGGGERKLVSRIWTQGRKKALIKILEPAKSKDMGNLRLDLNLWQYLPNIDRLVNIPPSMMLQSWMGSDFTNDDLVRSSSLTHDYTHQILSTEGNALKIECTPRPDAPIVWGKVIEWVRQSDAAPLKQEFYSERGELLKTMEGSEVQTFSSHTIPTVLKMTNVKKDQSFTVLKYTRVIYDQPLSEGIFTQEHLKKPLR